MERACLFARGRFIYFWMKRCFLSSISAVLIQGFQGVHPKNLLALQYVRNFLPSCVTCLYLSLSIHRSILRSCDCKFVFRFWWCHRNKEKGTVTSQKPNLCLWGNLHTEKITRQIIFKSIKAFKRYLLVFWSTVHKWKFSAELFTIQLNTIEKQS